MLRNTLILLLVVQALSWRTACAKENKDLMRADFYYSHYMYYKAVPYYEKVAEQMNNATVYVHLADCYTVLNDMDKAANAYDKAVQISPNDTGLVMKYAQVLMQLTRYDDALKQLTAFRSLKPADKRAGNMLAGCRMAMGKEEPAPDGIAFLLPCNTDGSDFGPTIWNGRLVFTSDTAIEVKKKTDGWTGRAYYNMFVAECDGAGNCNGWPVKLTQGKSLNIKYHDGPGTFTANGKQMYFTRSRVKQNIFGSKSVSNDDSTVVLEIMIASDYDTAAKKFRSVVPFAYNNEKYAVQHPSVSPDGTRLAFSSTMPGGAGGSDIYICHKAGDGWGAPQNAASINTEGEEVFPYWSDNATLCFSSDGHKGYGGLDIYRCRWNNGVAGTPENAGKPINSSYDDISLAMNDDARGIWFSSNRPAAKSGDNIYLYKKVNIYLQVTVLDSLTGQPIASANVTASADKDKKPAATTDEKGIFFTKVKAGMQYDISAGKSNYSAGYSSATATIVTGNDTLYRVIKLYAPPPPPKDVVPPMVAKKRNVMDTPGVREFVVGEFYELGHFHYDFDKYTLKTEHKVILDTLLTLMNRHPTMHIEIIAHTDCRGTAEYNQQLSLNRAQSVVSYLIEHGIRKERLSATGVGFTRPTISCECKLCTEEEHNLNRLLEFKVLQL